MAELQRKREKDLVCWFTFQNFNEESSVKENPNPNRYLP